MNIFPINKETGWVDFHSHRYQNVLSLEYVLKCFCIDDSYFVRDERKSDIKVRVVWSRDAYKSIYRSGLYGFSL